MSEVVIGPDEEALVMDYLRPLVGVGVTSNVPNPRPASFVRVNAVPFEGMTGKIVYRCLLSVESWHTNRPNASLLARRAAGYLEAAPAFVADCGSPGWLPDPDTGQSRYVFTVEVFALGSVLAP